MGFQNINGGNDAINANWAIGFVVSLRFIWWSRNKNFFRDKELSTAVFWGGSRTLWCLLVLASWSTPNGILVNLIRVLLPLCWQSPRPGWLKVNCDGVVTDHGASAMVGGYARDEFGNLVLRFSSFVGASSVVEAEGKAILMRLQIALRRGYMRIVVEYDFMVAVKYL